MAWTRSCVAFVSCALVVWGASISGLGPCAAIAGDLAAQGPRQTQGSPGQIEIEWIQPPPRPAAGEPSLAFGTGSLVGLPVHLAVRFFQTTISRMDGPRCPMHPTCSRYALEAVRRNGLWLGLAMTGDRLIRDNGDFRAYARQRIHGHLRYVDPVEAHEFWSFSGVGPDEE
ncbi:MAG: membrane protein insertion efficiency factor YidD [Nitrospirae bacterium]|nr:membrane protein insertion efficiency factor YidD [Nitrospirota bacterium]